MPNPFPGMNPYLEQPDYWSDFHNQLVAAIARQLIPQLLPKYRVVTDKWVYTVTDEVAMAIGRPDVSVQQGREKTASVTQTSVATVQPIKVSVPVPVEFQQSYLAVKDATTQAVVTVLEVLSPTNKRGQGREKYEAKRQLILGSQTNLVEFDLLRAGPPFLLAQDIVQSHYRILISRASQRPTADLYPFNLSTPIPTVPLPLREKDSEAVLDVQALVDQLHDQLGYEVFIDYTQKPPAPGSIDEVQAVMRGG